VSTPITPAKRRGRRPATPVEPEAVAEAPVAMRESVELPEPTAEAAEVTTASVQPTAEAPEAPPRRGPYSPVQHGDDGWRNLPVQHRGVR
jgi:hypothetical protein